MFGITQHTCIYIRTGVTDGRLGFEGLKAIVVKQMHQDPMQGGQLFAFCNRVRTRMKLFWWDGSGFYIASKRMRTGGFEFPRTEGAVQRMTLAQLEALLKGVQFVRRPPPR